MSCGLTEEELAALELEEAERRGASHIAKPGACGQPDRTCSSDKRCDGEGGCDSNATSGRRQGCSWTGTAVAARGGGGIPNCMKCKTAQAVVS